jgi:hypothetical protein
MIPLSRSLRRALVLSVAAASAGTAALAGLSASPASAAPAPKPVIVSCKFFTASGSVGTGSGCNHGRISGGGATQTTGTGTFVVTWNTGLTTTGTDTKTSIMPSRCPSAFPNEIEAFGDVTGGTATRLIGGQAHSFFCENTADTERELLPGTTWNM